MIWLVTLFTFLTITLLSLAIGWQLKQKKIVVDRLKQYGSQQQQHTVEVKASFFERVLRPFLRNFSAHVTSVAPQHAKNKLRKQLMMAGNLGGLQVNEFISLKIIITCLVFFLAGALRLPLLWIIFITIISWIAPNYYLKQKVAQRQQAIALAIPDVLDLLTVSVESGLGFDSAIARVIEKSKGPLAEEFTRMLQEMRIGKPRRDALRNLSTRTGVEYVQGLTTAIIQAEQLGVSIGKVLRIQSIEIRRKRRQLAEEQAMKAPIKMLFPLVIFVFPTLFIILLGPAVLQFMATM